MQHFVLSLHSSWCLCRSVGPFPTKPHPALCHFPHPSRSPDHLAGLGCTGVVKSGAAVSRNMGCKLRNHRSYPFLDSWGSKNMVHWSQKNPDNSAESRSWVQEHRSLSITLRFKCSSDPRAWITKVSLIPIRGCLGLFTVTESILRKIINSLSCLTCIDFCNYNRIGGEGAGGRKGTWFVFNLMHKLSRTKQLRRRGHAHPGCSLCSHVVCQTCWSAGSKITPCSDIMQCTELLSAAASTAGRRDAQGEGDKDRTSLMCISD